MLRKLRSSNIIEKIADWFSLNNIITTNHYNYAETLEKYSELRTYNNISDKNLSKRRITTKIPIEYSPFIQFGEHIKNIKKVMPKRTHLASFNTRGVLRKVLLYRVKIAGQNVKIEMHFYKNRLFFFKYIFSYAKKSERKELVKLLSKKYQIPNLDLSVHAIFDKNQNCIYVEDFTEFTISYTETENLFFKQLEEIKLHDHRQMVASYNLKAQTLFSSL
ncbi:hypothetical protein KFE94_03945 [bacterium SCSIO 12643]|nr:hypothetical protein KFE94_03945 [bacterium SCSIO 12643]